MYNRNLIVDSHQYMLTILACIFLFSILGLTDDGNEIHFQVNHLGHFLLTLEFIPLLLDSASQTGDSRIVIVTSTGHTSGVYDPTNFNGEREYSSLKFYCNSKLHNVCLQPRFYSFCFVFSIVFR